MALRLITAPVTEPVTWDEVRAFCRLNDDDEDVATALIPSARVACEQELRRALITQSWRKTIDAFPCEGNSMGIRLDYPPVITVDTVQYRDTAGDWQTLSAATYIVDDASEPGWLLPAYGYDWPETYDDINSVRVNYTVGYGNAAAVPQAIKTWIMLMVGHYCENRESATPDKLAPLVFIGGLLDPFRIYTL
jgi:uncharacterized phiE125 gp8 family phage protein